MQLATLLLKYLQNDLVHHRKELIKFGWNHLKREDSASKQWAFVNVCHFLDAYQAPEKIILQVVSSILSPQKLEYKTDKFASVFSQSKSSHFSNLQNLKQQFFSLVSFSLESLNGFLS